jgi:hypothetical protein
MDSEGFDGGKVRRSKIWSQISHPLKRAVRKREEGMVVFRDPGVERLG